MIKSTFFLSEKKLSVEICLIYFLTSSSQNNHKKILVFFFMNELFSSLTDQYCHSIHYSHQMLIDMSNMSTYYHNKSTDIQNKHNRYQLIYDDRNRPVDNQQRLSSVMLAFFVLLYRLNTAKVNIAINHSDPVLVNKCPMLNHLERKTRHVTRP